MDLMHALTSDEDSSKEFPKPRQDYIKFLFKNEMFADYPNLDMMGFPRNKMLVDVGTHYKNNSFGFRGEDWVGVSDILALGCSNTYGVGVPIDGTWPSILSKMSNSSVRSMSWPGASIHQSVSMAFKYFEMFGNPKTILCLFPDPYRIKIPSNPNLAISENKFSRLMHPLFLQSKNDMNERPKYSRRPHKYEDILPQEVALFMSTQHIHMLEQYCRSNNIKLIWSTWLDNFSKTINSIEENIFNSFVYDDEFTIRLQDFESECHTEFKEEFKKHFVSGLDVEDDEYFRHPGVHKHIHIAEAFYSRIKESTS